MIKGIHFVKKPRKEGPPTWYVYAARGGPQIYKCQSWTRPKLGDAEIRRLAEANDARIEKVDASANDLNSLIRLWRASPEWKRLAPSTQRTWSSLLDAIESKWGQTPLSVWNEPRMTAKVVSWRDSRASTPRTADNGITVLSALLKFGRLRGKIAINVAEGIPRLYKNGQRAEIIWTDDDLARFAAAAHELQLNHVGDGLRLAALTGLRRDDLVSLTWAEVGQNTIKRKASKISRGKRRTVSIPIFPALRELLDELRSRPRKDGVSTVLVNSFGQKWSRDGFGGSFNRVRDHAAIVHIDPETGRRLPKHLHDVRGTFCTKLITLAKLTDMEAAELMGWAPEQVAGIRKQYVDQDYVNHTIARKLGEAFNRDGGDDAGKSD